MIGDDDMIGKPGGSALNHFENPYSESASLLVELAGVKFRHDVVNIENEQYPYSEADKVSEFDIKIKSVKIK